MYLFYIYYVLYNIVLNMLAAEDIEAGRQKKKLQTEPTLPIYLKVNICTNINTYIRVKKKKNYISFFIYLENRSRKPDIEEASCYVYTTSLVKLI